MRVPLIIRAPMVATNKVGAVTHGLAELVDSKCRHSLRVVGGSLKEAPAQFTPRWSMCRDRRPRVTR